MIRFGNSLAVTGALLMAFVIAGCGSEPGATGSFDRNYTVSGPIRIEVSGTSGNIQITGSADGKVHVHGDVKASSFLFGDPQKRLDDLLANPPIEQKSDVIRVGKDLSKLRSVSINYKIEVPHDTEINSSVISGAQSIVNVRGPVKAEATSGAIRIERIERAAQLSTVSGSIDGANLGDDVRASTTSGVISIDGTTGDVRVSTASGAMEVKKPGGRVEAKNNSGTITIQGATNDVKARGSSGTISVQGNPAGNAYWDINTVSGNIQLAVPANSNFHLSADSRSGDIRADIPVVVEEQGKHSLRARIGDGGSRVEVRTTSGTINIRSSN